MFKDGKLEGGDAKVSEIKFRRDTQFRKQFFVPDSFAHPAKMDSQLLIWIVEHYTEAGETILDPMAGMGTTMLACTLGRDVILVELEEKFCKMMENNWEIVKMHPQLGYEMGDCQIIQGDARQLEGLLVDKIVTSNKGQGKGDMSVVYIAFFEVDNPIALLVKTLVPSPISSSLFERTMPEITVGFNDSSKCRQEEINRIFANGELADKLNSLLVKVFGNRAFKIREPSFSITFKGAENPPVAIEAVGLDIEGIATGSTLMFYAGSARCKEALFGADFLSSSFILVNSYPELLITNRTSPPEASHLSGSPTSTGAVFASIVGQLTGSPSENLPAYLASFLNTNSLSHLLIPLSIIPQISSIITSPPYEGFCEGGVDKSGERLQAKIDKGLVPKETARALTKGSMVVNPRYGHSEANIGNLKSQSYLEAMLQVYQQCFAVLKAGGLMILVTKNFIRNKQIVRLDEDTIKLCEQAGFSFLERHYRKLPSQSFWRVIYHQKHPEVEQINYEDILIFVKGGNNG